MGAFKRFLFSIMTIVLILLGAAFVCVGLIDVKTTYNYLAYLEMPNVRMGVMVVGIILLVFAIILLIDIIINLNKGYDYLINDEKGSVLITRNSLEKTVKSCANRFNNVESYSQKVKIINGEKIEAINKVNVYTDTNLDALSDEIRRAMTQSLKNLTGIENIDSKVYIDKKEEASKSELR